jgi:hypothetical protein
MVKKSSQKLNIETVLKTKFKEPVKKAKQFVKHTKIKQIPKTKGKTKVKISNTKTELKGPKSEKQF